MYSVFKELLKKNKVKVSDVVRATGISASTFADWKKGRYSPKRDKLQKIADYFDVTLDYLITGHNTEYNVTDIEYMIIVAYREAPEYKKQAILDLLDVEMEVKKDALDA